MRSTVKNAAKLAVYVEIMMSVKNHQALPAIRPEADLQQIMVNKQNGGAYF